MPSEKQRLGDLTYLISSGSTPLGGERTYLKSGSVAFIRSQNVRMNSLDLSDVAYITGEVDNQMRRSQVKFNDVLLNITGASIGRVAVFDRPLVRANVNQHVCIVRPDPERLSAGYLARLIASPKFQLEIDRIQNGGTRQALNFAQISDFLIPVPPLEEQARIAAILDKADAIRRKREQAIKLADKLLRTLFLDMFGDPVRNPKGWPVRFFREILFSIEAGTSVGGEQRDRQPGERAVLKISAVTSGIFKPNECKVVDVTSLPPMLVTPQIGDLLFSRANTRELVGATCLVHLHDPDLFLPDKIWRLSCNDELALPAYLHYVLSDDRFRKEFTKIATGTSGSMLNISQQKLLAYRLPVPPLPIQQSFAKAVKSTMLLRQKLIDLGIEASHLRSCLTSLAFRDGTSLWH